MFHRSVHRPDCWSRRASSTSQSSRPAATSDSNCRTHSAASNSAYQARKAARSSGDNLWIASSSSWIVLTLERYPAKSRAATWRDRRTQEIMPLDITAERNARRGLHGRDRSGRGRCRSNRRRLVCRRRCRAAPGGLRRRCGSSCWCRESTCRGGRRRRW